MSDLLPPLRRLAAVHDLSGLGKCSLTVALPVVSATGVECACIPTAVLSTHTGEFTGWTLRDLHEDMLHGEFAVALGIERSDVPQYIADTLEAAGA